MQSDVTVPEVMHTSLALSQQLVGLEGFLSSTQRPARASYYFSPCCLSRCFTGVVECAHIERERVKEREGEKVRDSVMHWVRGMSNYNHL